MRVPKAMEITFAFGSLFLEREQCKMRVARFELADPVTDKNRSLLGRADEVIDSVCVLLRCMRFVITRNLFQSQAVHNALIDQLGLPRSQNGSGAFKSQ
jgi:hypothetical protein